MGYSYPFKDTDEQTKILVWKRGVVVPGYDPSIWRRDVCGHAIKYGEHGNTSSQYGWEIDHIVPREHGGQTVLNNLQPLYWKTNRGKSDKLCWSCPN